MATTNFKLTKDKVTRRFSFPLRPPWDVLSAKIQSVYDIPAGRVAVSYIDSDGDVVTLSTNEELQDYYAAGLTLAHQLIRFDVVDLGALRETTSPTSTVRAIPTMGATSTQPQPNDPSSQWADEEFFDVGAEWPHYPDTRTFSGLFEGPPPPVHQSTPSELSHGFLETLKSDVSHVSKVFDSEVESDNESDIVDLSAMSPGLDKGKGRADMRPTVEEVPDEEISSDRSILCADAPQKIPVHVMDVHDHRSSRAYSERAPSVKTIIEKAISETTSSKQAYSEKAFYEQAYSDRTPTEKAPSVIADGFQPSSSSTPHMSVLSMDRSVLEASSVAEPIPDPPLAPLPTGDHVRALSPTFTTDIASLLNDLKNAFSSHPELSEGLRNIINHAGNGSYWAAHREAVSRAAASVSSEPRRSNEESRRQAEEEASRRVAEALGGLFRSFTTMTAGMRGDQGLPAAAPTPRETEARDRFEDGGSPCDSLWGSFRQTDRRGAPGGSGKRTSWGLPHYGPTQQFDWGRPLNLSSRYWGPESDTGNPFDDSAPRGPSRRRSLLGFPPQPSLSPMGRPGPPGPVPPPPPPPPHHRMHVHGHPHQRDHDRHSSRRFASDPMPPPPGADFPPPPPPPHHPNEAPRHDGLFMPLLSANPTPQELRERVEIAKQAYQMEKARYRKDREERKRDRRIQDETPQAPPAALPATIPPAVNPSPVVIPPFIPPPPPMPIVSAASSPQVASAARGSFPPLEVVNISKQSSDKPSPLKPSPPKGDKPTAQAPNPILKRVSVSAQAEAGPSGTAKQGLNGRQRSLHRITKKLADMGFTQSDYTALPQKIENQVGPKTPACKDDEDNVVTSVLEELLSMSPRSATPATTTPMRSRSPRRYSKTGSTSTSSTSVPGAWD